MTEGSPEPETPCREIAEEVSQEHDSDKVAALTQQLIDALKHAERSGRMPENDRERVPS